MIELKNIHKQYPRNNSPAPLVVLDNLNLQISAGESLAIVGPSGCGKSTLLHIAGALDVPTSGTVLLNNRDISQLNEKQRANIRNREIGFIFQLHYLLPQCTVQENILLPTLANSSPNNDQVGQYAHQLLKAVELTEFADYLPGQLSGGQRQRAAVARALINKPSIILADEPTGSLDEHTAETIGELLIKLNCEHQLTLLVVTHSPSLAGKMNRTYKLANGQLELHQ